MKKAFLAVLLVASLFPIPKISYADPDFDHVARAQINIPVTRAQATVTIVDRISCPGFVCTGTPYVVLRGGLRFGRFALCTDSTITYLYPCYRLTAQRVWTKLLNYNYFRLGYSVQIVGEKRGRDLIATWTDISTRRTINIMFPYAAGWSDADSRGNTGIEIYSSDSRVNPTANIIIENVSPAGGVITNDPPYYPVALSLTGWWLYKP